MSMTLTSPITGGAQTGFTAPTYTHVVDTAPDVNGKQYAISVAGGTQAGVTVHSVQSPFTVLLVRPRVFKLLGKTNPVTGLLPSVPKNNWLIKIRKGVIPLAGQPTVVANCDINVAIPAGSDTADPANLRAMLSAAIGALNQLSSSLGDSVIQGTL